MKSTLSNTISVTTEFTSPSSHSNTTGNLPTDVRIAINALYSDIYGEESQRCLIISKHPIRWEPGTWTGYMNRRLGLVTVTVYGYDRIMYGYLTVTCRQVVVPYMAYQKLLTVRYGQYDGRMTVYTAVRCTIFA